MTRLWAGTPGVRIRSRVPHFFPAEARLLRRHCQKCWPHILSLRGASFLGPATGSSLGSLSRAALLHASSRCQILRPPRCTSVERYVRKGVLDLCRTRNRSPRRPVANAGPSARPDRPSGRPVLAPARLVGRNPPHVAKREARRLSGRERRKIHALRRTPCSSSKNIASPASCPAVVGLSRAIGLAGAAPPSWGLRGWAMPAQGELRRRRKAGANPPRPWRLLEICLSFAQSLPP